MKIRPQTEAALTVIEVVIIIWVLLILLALILAALSRAHGGLRISCMNNLKQVSLALRIWAGDRQDRFPMQVSTNDGGTKEFVGTAAATFHHFEIASNELSSPKILFCPQESDRKRRIALQFALSVAVTNLNGFGSNSNLSYFIGVNATLTNPATLLVGDRNVTNGFPVRNGLLELKTNQPVGWTKEMHKRVGNIGLADGSVQQVTSQALRELLKQTGAETTRLAMP